MEGGDAMNQKPTMDTQAKIESPLGIAIYAKPRWLPRDSKVVSVHGTARFYWVGQGLAAVWMCFWERWHRHCHVWVDRSVKGA